MAWTYANWQTATASAAITAVDQAAKTFTVSGFKLDRVKAGDYLAVDTGANAGTYIVVAVAYSPDATVVTVGTAPPSATVAGNLVFGATPTTRLYFLRQHHAEVAAAISASVSADGVSHNSETLRQYLASVESSIFRAQRQIGGMFVAGRLRA